MVSYGLSIYIACHFPFGAVVLYWQKYVHEVPVDRLGGLSLPRKRVARLPDRLGMTIDVCERKTTTQQQLSFRWKMDRNRCFFYVLYYIVGL